MLLYEYIIKVLYFKMKKDIYFYLFIVWVYLKYITVERVNSAHSIALYDYRYGIIVCAARYSYCCYYYY